MVLALLRAMRLAQWTKNLFVLAPLGFAYGDRSVADPVDAADLVHTLLALVSFCLASSAVYLLNDILDVERDRAHPVKRLRPIASGELPPKTALAAAGAFVAVALVLAFAAGERGYAVAALVGAYALLNVAYSLRLKHVVLLDAFCVATGFLMRVGAGGLAADADVSHWLMLCTLFLSLFLALNKRRAEIDQLGPGRGEHRRTLEEYDLPFLDQLVTLLGACTVVCYALYTVDDETMAKFGAANHLVWSVPFVVLGIARYMFLVHTRRGGDNPTRVLLGGDAVFLMSGLAWLAVVCAVLVWGW